MLAVGFNELMLLHTVFGQSRSQKSKHCWGVFWWRKFCQGGPFLPSPKHSSQSIVLRAFKSLQFKNNPSLTFKVYPQGYSIKIVSVDGSFPFWLKSVSKTVFKVKRNCIPSPKTLLKIKYCIFPETLITKKCFVTKPSPKHSSKKDHWKSFFRLIFCCKLFGSTRAYAGYRPKSKEKNQDRSLSTLFVSWILGPGSSKKFWEISGASEKVRSLGSSDWQIGLWGFPGKLWAGHSPLGGPKSGYS